MTYVLLLIFVLTANVSFAAARNISQSEMKEKWPLTIPEGEVECRAGQVLLFRNRTQVYALNGTARTKMPKLQPIDAIWKADPKIPGAKINIGPLMEEARKLCQ